MSEWDMKVRIGYGLGTRSPTHDHDRFFALVDALEQRRFDSLWFSDRISGDAPDPVVAMAMAAARTSRMKLGMSVMVLPGRNPAVVAKQLASLDRLSGGRLLPAFGLGARDAVEHQAFGVRREERAALFGESLALIRRLWTGEVVDHDGDRFQMHGVQVLPRPAQDPIEVWLGGVAPSELRRVGRMGDGWLPSFCTPAEVEAGIATINDVAQHHDRHIDPEHFGALIAYAHGEVPDAIARFVQRRRPELDPTDVVPVGIDGVIERIRQFVDIGASKFVLLPLVEPTDWIPELDVIAERVLPLQT
ncbi:MAG: LLM class flavin-dependent oxidoreductase [Acidimicrobiia bacterium]|nr:LLM class flavin-dependent oxidoreductase [Acidimicrobiia bacterium]